MSNSSSVPLPEGKPQYLRIVWGRAGGVECAFSYSRQVVGRELHWVNGKTEMCVHPMLDCVWHREGYPLRWYGWLAGHSCSHRCLCLIQLTEQCVRQSIQLRDPGIDLRGAEIRLSRSGTHPKAAVRAEVRLSARQHGIPEVEPEVLELLARFYGVPLPLEGRHSLNREDDQ